MILLDIGGVYMYYVAICDDDQKYMRYMIKNLNKCGMKDEITNFYEYTSGEELLQAISVIEHIDLLIIDIYMKKYDGNAIIKQFRKQFPTSLIVICSKLFMPTVELFETSPFRYILKQYSDERMKNEIKVVVHEIESKHIEPSVIGTFRYQDVRLKLKDILYISKARNGSGIHITQEAVKNEYDQQLTSRKKLQDFYEELKEFNFEYAHNSYIVNLEHIVRKTTKDLVLSNGVTLSISRSKEKQLRQVFDTYKSKNNIK